MKGVHNFDIFLGTKCNETRSTKKCHLSPVFLYKWLKYHGDIHWKGLNVRQNPWFQWKHHGFHRLSKGLLKPPFYSVKSDWNRPKKNWIGNYQHRGQKSQSELSFKRSMKSPFMGQFQLLFHVQPSFLFASKLNRMLP